jgi:threonine/homoserine efflux transporter RhtA
VGLTQLIYPMTRMASVVLSWGEESKPNPFGITLLTVALRELEVGPAYAVWTGMGAAGAAAVGMIFLGDAVSTTKLVSIALILAGVIGLNLSGVTP